MMKLINSLRNDETLDFQTQSRSLRYPKFYASSLFFHIILCYMGDVFYQWIGSVILNSRWVMVDFR